MNQYSQITSVLAKMLFKKDSPLIPANAFPPGSEPAIVHTRLLQLLAENKINTAENMLFDVFDKKKPFHLAIGIDFYARVAELSPEALEAADFTLEEVGEGLTDMMNFYGVKLVRQRRAPTPEQLKAAQLMAEKMKTMPINVMSDKRPTPQKKDTPDENA